MCFMIFSGLISVTRYYFRKLAKRSRQQPPWFPKLTHIVLTGNAQPFVQKTESMEEEKSWILVTEIRLNA